MTTPQREQRLRDDVETLRILEQASTIFSFTPHDPSSQCFTLRFQGSGVCRDSSPSAAAKLVEQHEIELRLPTAYPDFGPELRWRSPIYHPNVSYGGFVNLADLGLDWSPEMGLDIMCERLWDVIRLAYFNIERAVNHAAKTWTEEQTSVAWPVDARPLRDRAAASNRNVVSYRRRTEFPPSSREQGSLEHREILFLGEVAATPHYYRAVARSIEPLPSTRGSAGPPRNDDDILYIE